MKSEKSVKNVYWQRIRGLCILAVVLIHSFTGFNYVGEYGYETAWILIRQLINFAVAVFIFMAGYFVNLDKISSPEFSYKTFIISRCGRLVIPFCVWSLVYTGVSVFQAYNDGVELSLLGIIYRFVVGKAATPLYYIVVMVQLTLLTPWLVKEVKKGTHISKALWMLTPCYLLYVYGYHLVFGKQPMLYETFFPAWFLFYYLGINIRCRKPELIRLCNRYGNIKFVILAWVLSCGEALMLREFAFSSSFYVSQITIGSFLYSFVLALWLTKCAEFYKNKLGNSILSKVGDCSYGVFYIHMFVLMIVAKFIQTFGLDNNWFSSWCIPFIVASVVSVGIVWFVQNMAGKLKLKKILVWVGFV